MKLYIKQNRLLKKVSWLLTSDYEMNAEQDKINDLPFATLRSYSDRKHAYYDSDVNGLNIINKPFLFKIK